MIKKLLNYIHTVVTKYIYTSILLITIILLAPFSLKGQSNCVAYDPIFEGIVERLFTSEKHESLRQQYFPVSLHHVLKNDISHISLPDDQLTCEIILSRLHGDDPVPGPPRYRALYKIKDHYFLATWKVTTDEQGNEMISPPSSGVLFDPELNIIDFILL